MKKAKYIVGIDEVGRGPLAGPVTVGVFVCEKGLYSKLKRRKDLPPVGKDSKKLSEKDREQYSKVLKEITLLYSKSSKSHSQVLSLTNFNVCHVSNVQIDRKGIAVCIRKAIETSLKKLKVEPEECEVLLDGGLKAPGEFKYQKTIIKGDEKEKIIAWASILAKVSRDELMRKSSKKFPSYGFEIHKGYGTSKHRENISTFGLSPFHRKTFCKKCVL